jgi:hypothetical protein
MRSVHLLRRDVTPVGLDDGRAHDHSVARATWAGVGSGLGIAVVSHRQS